MSPLNIYIDQDQVRQKFVIHCSDHPNHIGKYTAKLFDDHLESICITMGKSPIECIDRFKNFLENNFGKISRINSSPLPEYLCQRLLKDRILFAV